MQYLKMTMTSAHTATTSAFATTSKAKTSNTRLSEKTIPCPYSGCKSRVDNVRSLRNHQRNFHEDASINFKGLEGELQRAIARAVVVGVGHQKEYRLRCSHCQQIVNSRKDFRHSHLDADNPQKRCQKSKKMLVKECLPRVCFLVQALNVPFFLLHSFILVHSLFKKKWRQSIVCPSWFPLLITITPTPARTLKPMKTLILKKQAVREQCVKNYE